MMNFPTVIIDGIQVAMWTEGNLQELKEIFDRMQREIDDLKKQLDRRYPSQDISQPNSSKYLGSFDFDTLKPQIPGGKK